MTDRPNSRRIARVLARPLRLSAAGLLCLALALIVAHNTARAFNTYADYFVRLSARPLAMGGAAGALCDPASVFYNPAGLAGVRNLTLLYNHSARHFPGSQEGGMREWDQLDGDTEAVVVPLMVGTYAHGFTFSGELGYDYRGHPADGRLGYPRERYWGTEDYDAFATSGGLPVAVGIGLRRSLGRFTPDPADPRRLAWLRHGEGEQWGVLARVWPGLDYGVSELKLNYDWTVFDNASGERGFPEFASKHITHREGWALYPTGWLTLTRDVVDENHIYDKQLGTGVGQPVGLGPIHMGNQERQTQHSGAELCLGSLLKLRRGDYDGQPTVGVAFNLGGLWLNYAEAEGLLPLIVDGGSGFEDVHIYGAELNLW